MPFDGVFRKGILNGRMLKMGARGILASLGVPSATFVDLP